MSFLTGIEIRRQIESGEIEIHSLDAAQPFSVDNQVTEDSIDLRLAPIAMTVGAGVKILDYLDPGLSDAYETIEIPAEGIELRPLEPLLTQTLEMVCLSHSLIGMVVTRSTFARLGIMTTCMAPKFATGIRWAFPLQIVNLNRFPVRIYPYAPMVQLLVSPMVGEPIGYRGRYQDSVSPTPPIVGDRERESLDQMNPKAVNRTFHIINQDKRSRNFGGRDQRARRAGTDRPDQKTQALRLGHKVSLIVISIIAAAAFGLAGNLLAAGSLSYWQIFSLVLLVLIGGLLSGLTLLLQTMWRAAPAEPAGIVESSG
ncbi:dCTP deaminase [Micromonospora ureilytica]|uniref:dCTP deaminase n=1 Tax=Micromonospora ureilytica TaxID=709868 RepID=UPI000F5F14B9|nr:hypothetical protein [Micromonospora ureilytica]